jgi:hypothetical protein
MKYDIPNRRIYVRQSWLNDVMICPERSRLGLTLPEFRMGSDATMIGTAVHYAIERYLNGHYADLGDDHVHIVEAMQHEAVTEYERLILEPHRNTGLPDVRDCIDAMVAAWYDDIRTEVALGGKVEAQFDVPLGFVLDGYEVRLQGTMDYVAPDGVIWDWKTAGRTYNARDKQQHAIQATVYAFAAGNLAWVDDPSEVIFKYGVMIRQKSPKAQVVAVHRNREHFAWLRNQVQSVVTMSHKLGTELPWIRNDQGNLCSEKWCDFWSVCKGACVSSHSMSSPIDMKQTVA